MHREPTLRGAHPSVRMPQRGYWSDVVRIGTGRAANRFEDENDSDHRVTSTVEARSAGVIGPPGGRNRLTNRAPATTQRAAPGSPSSRRNSPSRTGDIQQASSSEAMTEALVYKLSWGGLKTSRRTSNRTSDKLFQLRASLVGAAGQILWAAEKQSTVDRIVALLKARFDSENQAERFRAERRSESELKVNRCKNSIKRSVG